jgi:hypothetical protein
VFEAFPRPPGRSLIEARRVDQGEQEGRHSFPRPPGRGLIEARQRKEYERAKAEAFRGLRAAASLERVRRVDHDVAVEPLSAASGPRPH